MIYPHVLPARARAAADKRRKPRKPLRWSEALAEAPWLLDEMPGAWEHVFRAAYAKRLVQRGLALTASRSGSRSGPSGVHRHPITTIRASEEERQQWRVAAKHAGLSLSDWARRILGKAVADSDLADLAALRTNGKNP